MSQIVPGVLLGITKGATQPTGVFCGAYDPANATDDNILGASAGSLFLRVDTGDLYVKATSGSWTKK